jgi:hypothetical protein
LVAHDRITARVQGSGFRVQGPGSRVHHPSERDNIVVFNCFDLRHKLPDSSER